MSDFRATYEFGEPILPKTQGAFDELVSRCANRLEAAYFQAVAAGVDNPILIVADLNGTLGRKAFQLVYGAGALAEFDALPAPPEGQTVDRVLWAAPIEQARQTLNAVGMDWIAASLGHPISSVPCYEVVFIEYAHTHLGSCAKPELTEA